MPVFRVVDRAGCFGGVMEKWGGVEMDIQNPTTSPPHHPNKFFPNKAPALKNQKIFALK
jgi:hypothetical protein